MGGTVHGVYLSPSLGTTGPYLQAEPLQAVHNILGRHSGSFVFIAAYVLESRNYGYFRTQRQHDQICPSVQYIGNDAS